LHQATDYPNSVSPVRFGPKLPLTDRDGANTSWAILAWPSPAAHCRRNLDDLLRFRTKVRNRSRSNRSTGHLAPDWPVTLFRDTYFWGGGTPARPPGKKDLRNCGDSPWDRQCRQWRMRPVGSRIVGKRHNAGVDRVGSSRYGTNRCRWMQRCGSPPICPDRAAAPELPALAPAPPPGL